MGFCSLSMFAQSADVMKSDAIMEESMQNFDKAAMYYEGAAKMYEQASVIDTLCWYRAGVCYLRLKEYQKALPVLTKLESVNILTSDICIALGDTYVGLKDQDKARLYYLKAVEVNAESKVEAYKKLTALLYNGKKFEESVKYADEVLLVDSAEVNVLYFKTLSHEQLNQLDQAIETCQRLLGVKPDHAKGVEKMGLLYARKVDVEYDKEKKRYESMKAPSRIDFYNTTKKLESISQGYKKAIPYLEQAQAKNPANETINNVLSQIRKRLSND